MDSLTTYQSRYRRFHDWMAINPPPPGMERLANVLLQSQARKDQQEEALARSIQDGIDQRAE